MCKHLPILLIAYGLAVTTEDIYDNSFALIIGIDKYQNVKPLNYAVKDAESIHDILVNTFDSPEGTTIIEKDKEKYDDKLGELEPKIPENLSKDTSYTIRQDTTIIGQIPSESGSVSVLENDNENSWPHYQFVFISFNIGFNGINYNELTNTLIENEFDDLKPETQISDNLPFINDFISNPKVHMGFEITGYPTKLMLAGLKWNFLSEHTAKNNNLNATLKSHFVYADIGLGLNRHSFSIAPLSIGMGGLFNKLEFKRGINPNSFNELINEFSINEEINQNLFIINLGSRLDFHFWPEDDYFFNVGVKVNYLISPFNSKWKYGEDKKMTSKPAIFANNPTIEISIGVGGMSD